MQKNNKNIQHDAQQKAVIYCRVSSKGQEEDGHGLESQESRCRDYANARGYAVEAVFPDTITGGGDFMKRPGMVALLSFLDAQPQERFVVIFDDLKRFARDTKFHLDLREAFRLRCATMECLNFKFEDTPEGEFIETIMAAQGALERKQNGRQVAQKMKARMQSGYWVHSAPVGYRYQTVKGRGKILVPDESLAPIIREAFEGFAIGRFESQAEVTRFLDSFPDFPRNKKGEIVQQRVSDILTNPLYTGHICSETYGIDWLNAQHEAIVSLETFEKVQQCRTAGAPTPKRKDVGNVFTLRGIVTCTDCGVPLRSCVSRGNGGEYPYYLCQTKGCASYGKSIKRDVVEDAIGDLVKTLQPTESLIALAGKMFRHAWDQRLSQAKEVVIASQRKIAALDRKIDTLIDRISDASNPSLIASYEDKISILNREKRMTVEKSQNQRLPEARFEEKLEPLLQFLSNPWKLWESGNTALRRTVLKLAFNGRIPYCRFKGARTSEISFPFKALTADSIQEFCFGAAEKTRTSTGVTPQRPQRCASTNSATAATRLVHLTKVRRSCNKRLSAEQGPL